MPQKGHEGARLRNCAQVGDVIGLEAQLKNGVDADSADEVTAMWLAAAAGKIDCVKMLIKFGANVNCKREKDNVTALFIAAQNGNDAVVAAILEVSTRTINTPKHNGATPLLIASQQGHLSIAERLLQMGADPDVKKEQDVTAFMLACFMGNADLAALLLRHGADPALKGGGKTGMEWGKSRGNKKVVAVVWHYTNIVSKVTTEAGGYVHAVYRKWLQFTLDRTSKKVKPPPVDSPESPSPTLSPTSPRSGRRREARRKSSELYLDVLSDNGDFTLDKTNDFLDSTHIEYAGTSGNRLRSVIIPSTLEQAVGWKAPHAHHTHHSHMEVHGGYTSEDDSQESLTSTIRSIPSIDTQSEAADPHQAVAISHQYLRRLERTYEAEFGKPPGDGIPDYTPPTEVAQQSPHSKKKIRKMAEIESSFKMFYPKEIQRREAMEGYLQSHTVLSKVHNDYHIPKGNAKLSVNGSCRAKLCSELAAPRVPAANREFSYPSEGRIDGRDKKDSQWKREMTSQIARERKAIRAATSKAVLANMHKKALRGQIHCPQLSSGDAVPNLINSKSRDTTCSPAYAKFHRSFFE